MIAGGATFTTRDCGGHTLWQRRFWEHTIRDETNFDYIHYNPVKHGHVADPQDWPYSSLHRFVSQRILPPNCGEAVAADGLCEFDEPSDR